MLDFIVRWCEVCEMVMPFLQIKFIFIPFVLNIINIVLVTYSTKRGIQT